MAAIEFEETEKRQTNMSFVRKCSIIIFTKKPNLTNFYTYLADRKVGDYVTKAVDT